MILLRALHTIASAKLLSLYHALWCQYDTTKCFNGRYLYLRCMGCGWESQGIDLGGRYAQ